MPRRETDRYPRVQFSGLQDQGAKVPEIGKQMSGIYKLISVAERAG